MATTSTVPQATVPVPDLPTLLDLKIRDILASTNCHQLGTIEIFNPVTVTATVSLNMKASVAGSVEEYPLLVDVPVFVLGGGDRVVTLPINPGDTCLVLFNDRDIDLWFSTGSAAVPNSPRIHDLSDGLALIGFRSSANPVSNYSSEDVEIRNAESKIAVGELLLLKNSVTDLLSVLQLGALAMASLNGVKVGGDASAQIATFNSELSVLLKSS